MPIWTRAPHHRAVFAGTCLSLIGIAFPGLAYADGFALNRFEPAGPSAHFFSADTLGYQGKNRFFVGGVVDWARNPLVAYDSTGARDTVIVEDQLFAHLGATFIGLGRLRLNVMLPVMLYQNGTAKTVGGTAFAPSDGAGLGDLRLTGDLRLFGEAQSGFELAAGFRLHLPTGSQQNLTSDGQIRIAPRLQAAGRVGPFEYAVRFGGQLRPRDSDVAGTPFGSELEFGAAAGYRLIDDKLLVGPELWGTTSVSDGGKGFFGKTTTAFELIGGVHYFPSEEWNLGLGFGPGLTRGLGAPETRALLSVEFTPRSEPLPPPDRDQDGVLDSQDACPNEYGSPSVSDAKNGCPVPLDRDQDGIVDDVDSCPDEKGVPSFDASQHGCPVPSDQDGDSVIDAEDACPTEAGIAATKGETKRGCPEPVDRDSDTIEDASDACPDQPGVASEVASRNGCPAPETKGDQLVILERIEFGNDSAELLPESTKALEVVLSFLQAQPSAKLRIEGHTDNRGGQKRNTKLSAARAAAVVTWLTSHGIAAERLRSEGFGPTKPIAKNDDEAGRKTNRRVEFHIVTDSKSQGATP